MDLQFELERKIIELLLLYGNEEEEFEDLMLEATEEGEITFKPEMVTSKVFEKVYLDLQEDEIEFANDEFKELYFEIIDTLNQKQELKLESFVNELEPERAEAITHILMEDEKYQLAEWDRKEIYVKQKKATISQMVSETILNLRRHLVTLKIDELSQLVKEHEDTSQKENKLQDIVDYITLKKVLSEKLNRVL